MSNGAEAEISVRLLPGSGWTSLNETWLLIINTRAWHPPLIKSRVESEPRALWFMEERLWEWGVDVWQPCRKGKLLKSSLWIIQKEKIKYQVLYSSLVLSGLFSPHRGIQNKMSRAKRKWNNQSAKHSQRSSALDSQHGEARSPTPKGAVMREQTPSPQSFTAPYVTRLIFFIVSFFPSFRKSTGREFSWR